jgi:hypothetical protein
MRAERQPIEISANSLGLGEAGNDNKDKDWSREGRKKAGINNSW